MSRPNTPSSEEREALDELTRKHPFDDPESSDDVSLMADASDHDHNHDHGERHHGERDSNAPDAYGTRRTSQDSSGLVTLSVQEAMDELVGDINAMIESASSIVESARQIRQIVRHSLETVDLHRPAVSQLGLVGTIRDLRRETVRAVVDADRARLRYSKVLTEFTQLRRCLRRLGVIPSPPSTGGYGVWYSHAMGGEYPQDSAGSYKDFEDS